MPDIPLFVQYERRGIIILNHASIENPKRDQIGHLPLQPDSIWHGVAIDDERTLSEHLWAGKPNLCMPSEVSQYAMGKLS
jgi:hypothetical protein